MGATGTSETVQYCSDSQSGKWHSPRNFNDLDYLAAPGQIYSMANVLLIDADYSSRMLLKNNLEYAGHTVSVAGSFAEGHEYLRQMGTEVVLTDLHISNSESLRLIDHLHTEFPLVKILVIVGQHETVDFLAVRMIGADDVLRQPLTSKTLLDAVEQALVEEEAS